MSVGQQQPGGWSTSGKAWEFGGRLRREGFSEEGIQELSFKNRQDLAW